MSAHAATGNLYEELYARHNYHGFSRFTTGTTVARVVTQARDHPGTHARVRGFRRRFSGEGGERASHVVGIGKQAQGDLGDAAEHGARHGRPVDGRRGHVRLSLLQRRLRRAAGQAPGNEG